MKFFRFTFPFVPESPARVVVPIQSPADMVLEKAADLLDERGWAQKLPRDEKGRMCIVAAIYSASDDLGLARRVTNEAVEKVASHIKLEDSSEIIRWNDTLLFFGAYRVKRALRGAARS